MRMFKIECNNCGAKLDVKPGINKIKCNFCGTTTVLDDDDVQVKHIMEGQISEEQKYINAETNLKLKNYIDSYNEYLELSKKYVNDPTVWLGLLRSYTNDFTLLTGSKTYRSNFEKYWNNFSTLADEKDIDEYKEKFEEYESKFKIGTNPFDEIRIGEFNKNVDIGTLQEPSIIRIIVVILGGMFGIHKFMDKKIFMGIIYLFTGGLFGIGWIIDVIKEAIAYRNYIK